jgi:hypothetical protein
VDEHGEALFGAVPGGQVDGVEASLEAGAEERDGFVEGIEFVGSAVPVDIGGVAGAVPDDPEFGGTSPLCRRGRASRA